MSIEARAERSISPCVRSAVTMVHSPREKDLDKYGALLADDVNVVEDGTVVASNKAEWLNEIGERFASPTYHQRVVELYQGPSGLLMVESIANLSLGPSASPDCCVWYRATEIVLTAGKITRMRSGPAYWTRLTPDGKRTD